MEEKDNMKTKESNEAHNYNNKIKELIKEGIISIKSKNDSKEIFFDINNIKNIDYEKLLKKIINLNRTLNSIQSENMRLINEKKIFSNEFKNLNQKSDDKGKDLISFPDIKYRNDNIKNTNLQNLLKTKNKEELLKKYENDLDFFDEFIKEFNGEIDILK